MQYQKLSLCGRAFASSHIFIIQMEIQSQPCALLLFNDWMMDTIRSSENETFSILILILYSNGGNVATTVVNWSTLISKNGVE